MTPDPTFVRFLDSQGKTLNGLPFYRLVWSDDQFEYRKGTFNEFSGDIFLRTVTATKLVPKYPYLPQRWILEKYFPPEKLVCEELPNASANPYEPLFAFQDKNCNPLPVNLRILAILVGFDRDRNRISTPQTACADRTLEELSETKEFQQLYDSIDTNATLSCLHNKEGIIRP